MEAVRMSETKNGKKRSLTKCDSKKAKGKKIFLPKFFGNIKQNSWLRSGVGELLQRYIDVVATFGGKVIIS